MSFHSPPRKRRRLCAPVSPSPPSPLPGALSVPATSLCGPHPHSHGGLSPIAAPLHSDFEFVPPFAPAGGDFSYLSRSLCSSLPFDLVRRTRFVPDYIGRVVLAALRSMCFSAFPVSFNSMQFPSEMLSLVVYYSWRGLCWCREGLLSDIESLEALFVPDDYGLLAPLVSVFSVPCPFLHRVVISVPEFPDTVRFLRCHGGLHSVCGWPGCSSRVCCVDHYVETLDFPGLPGFSSALCPVCPSILFSLCYS